MSSVDFQCTPDEPNTNPICELLNFVRHGMLALYFSQLPFFKLFLYFFYFTSSSCKKEDLTLLYNISILGFFCMWFYNLLLPAVVSHWWECSLKPSTVHVKNIQSPEHLSLSQYLQIRSCFLLKFPTRFLWQSVEKASHY